ncbi:MAG TPA: endonuclease domain-containing protein [Fimbriiglobus sp.]
MTDHTRLARQLRREMTPAEVILWRELRGRRFEGAKFRRQQPVGPFIVDFLCAELKLVIELGGDTHSGREVDDQARQESLEVEGFRVLRYTNPDIYDDLETVLNDIWSAIDAARRVAAADPSPPSPLPQGERGERG